MIALLCTKARLLDPVLHVVHLVPMCALVGLVVPRRPLVAELNYDERALVWALLIESGHIPRGHIPLRPILGTCSRDLYRPLRLRLLAWAQRVVFQDLHHVWALLQANRKLICRCDVHDRAPVYQGLLIASFPTLLRLRVSIFLVCCSFYLH